MKRSLLSTAAVVRLLRLVPHCGVRDRLLDRYWERYWRKVELEEAKELGIAPGQPTPPIRGSERAVLLEVIADSIPFGTLLEVGCGYAQNFEVLATQHPSARIVGVDRDSERIQAGQQFLAKRNIDQAMLIVSDANDLSGFEDRSVDIVFTCAILLFIPPEEILQVIKELFRVARKYVILLEQHQPVELNSQVGSNTWPELGVQVDRDTGVSDYYLRDYQRLLERFASAEQIELIPVPNPRWQIEQWTKFASVFRVSV